LIKRRGDDDEDDEMEPVVKRRRGGEARQIQAQDGATDKEKILQLMDEVPEVDCIS
jgi:hypothetical protein